MKRMTLKEISQSYRDAAVPLRKRLSELRTARKATTDPEEIFHLDRRIAALTPMLTQCNELAELTAHYYDRGYYRNDAYTVNGIPEVRAWTEEVAIVLSGPLQKG